MHRFEMDVFLAYAGVANRNLISQSCKPRFAWELIGADRREQQYLRRRHAFCVYRLYVRDELLRIYIKTSSSSSYEYPPFGDERTRRIIARASKSGKLWRVNPENTVHA